VVLTQILPFVDPDALDCLWALERAATEAATSRAA
jgi:hypothetical protein